MLRRHLERIDHVVLPIHVDSMATSPLIERILWSVDIGEGPLAELWHVIGQQGPMPPAGHGI